jgi:hypothetical protein
MTRTFSPSEAALSVFELAKRQPQFVLRFCIIYALFFMILCTLAGGLGVGEALLKFVALAEVNKNPDREVVRSVLELANTGITIMLIFGLIAGVLTSGMGLRKAMRDEDAGLFGLQFGGDEARLLASMLLIWAILTGVSIIVLVVGGAVSMGNVNVLTCFFVAAIVLATFVGLRLSLYAVLSIANRSIDVVKSWHETKGQTWRLLGAYLLWGLIAYLLTLVVQTIGIFGASLLGTKIVAVIPATLAEFVTPGWLLYALIYGLVAGFGNLGSICIGAYAWHQMRGDLPAQQPSTRA